MTLSWKARRRWALFALVIALPLYIIVALNVVALFERPHFLIELVIYAVLGLIWAIPLKRLFLGISQPDPDAPKE
ncbi:MAG: DUF2842 domain-containing protein [Natronohydrobacter sp.]|nr:DUF2842 domain-containing protein [Natronohydrobacter sp.]TVR47382.1 MAG: DUF2842 domain-containing protein [Paracoccaceae bacterium]